MKKFGNDGLKSISHNAVYEPNGVKQQGNFWKVEVHCDSVSTDESVRKHFHEKVRVMEVYLGDDDVGQSAKTKTEGEKLNRPVVKMAPLFYQ